MKTIGLRLALPAVLALAFVSPGRAIEHDVVPSKDFDAKVQYCKTCHGLSGQGFRGAYPMPRLAGQQPEYLENQLRAFIERRRTNPVMFNVSHVLSPSMVTALAAYFKNLDPKPLGGSPRELAAAGKRIYQEGIAGTDIPACASCHGEDAKGQGAFPRLAAQLHDLHPEQTGELEQGMRSGSGRPDTSAIMEPIAHGLTRPQIAAVAAYLSYLE